MILCSYGLYPTAGHGLERLVFTSDGVGVGVVVGVIRELMTK